MEQGATGFNGAPPNYGYTLIPASDSPSRSRPKEFVANPRRRSKEPPSGCMSRWLDGHFTISPEGNFLLDAWDVVVMLALVLTAFVLPVEVALIRGEHRLFTLIDNGINIVFMVDIVLTFNIAFTARSATSQEAYERRPLRIAQHYMAVPFSQNMEAGWFWPDVITIIPWDDLVGKRATSVRFVRVLRLGKMLRLVRVIKLFRRWQTHIGFSYALVQIMRTSCITAMIVHWLTCSWAYLGTRGAEYGHSASDTWLSMVPLAQHKDLADFTIVETYYSALYFCTVVLTTVGFGDLYPVNATEVQLMIATIVITGLTWAWVVANVVGVIGRLDHYDQQFNQVMDDMNSLMRTEGATSKLEVRVRRHLHEAYNVHRQRLQQETLCWLSAGLQGELAVESGVGHVVDCVWFFRGCEQSGWLVDLAQQFTSEMFSPGEMILARSSVSVIRKGSCVKRARVLFRDDVFGDDMILVTDVLRDTACPQSLTLCEVMTLSKEALIRVCTKHKELDQRLRRAQVKLAVWRAFIYAADKIRRSKEKHYQKMRGGSKQQPVTNGTIKRLAHQRTTICSVTGPLDITTVRFGQTRKGWSSSASEAGTDGTQTEVLGTLLREVREFRQEEREHRKRMEHRLDVLEHRMDVLDKGRDGIKGAFKRGWMKVTSPLREQPTTDGYLSA